MAPQAPPSDFAAKDAQLPNGGSSDMAKIVVEQQSPLMASYRQGELIKLMVS